MSLRALLLKNLSGIVLRVLEKFGWPVIYMRKNTPYLNLLWRRYLLVVCVEIVLFNVNKKLGIMQLTYSKHFAKSVWRQIYKSLPIEYLRRILKNLIILTGSGIVIDGRV